MNWKEQFSKYYGSMFECGDFDRLINDIDSILQQKDQEWREKIEKWANEHTYDIREVDGLCVSCGLDMYDCVCSEHNSAMKDIINFIKQ